MPCNGWGECRQGRAPCRTPLSCSGIDADEAIEAFRLHRHPLPQWTEPEEVREPDISRIAQAIVAFIALGCAFAFIASILS